MQRQSVKNTWEKYQGKNMIQKKCFTVNIFLWFVEQLHNNCFPENMRVVEIELHVFYIYLRQDIGIVTLPPK